VKALLLAVALLGLTACGSVALRPAGPSPSQAPSSAGTVTDTDENKTLTYHVGDTFELQLHEQSGWTMWENVTASDRSVLQPMVDTHAASVRGVTLAKFKAAAPGTSDITATASMACSPGVACAALARVWKVTIQVV
jgi:predicted secreted protein